MPMLDPENRDRSPVAQLDVPVHFEHHFYFRGGAELLLFHIHSHIFFCFSPDRKRHFDMISFSEAISRGILTACAAFQVPGAPNRVPRVHTSHSSDHLSLP